MPFTRYNAQWTDDYQNNPLALEMACIRKGGKWKAPDGRECGLGLMAHYRAMRTIIWPHLDEHRWHLLTLQEVLKNEVTVLMGCASSGKTNSCWIFLCEYFCFPQETAVLVSSTDVRGLRMRVWGEISDLWQRAKDKFPDLPGFMIDSRIAITTDSLEKVDDDSEERRVRDMRKGIIGIPTVMNGSFVGLGKWAGTKQKRVRLIADEAQFMGPTFLSAFSNLVNNPSFKAIVLGNPNDILDPLGKAGEPLDGWEKYMNPEKTTVWLTRFLGGTCINFVGTDSPNNDFDPALPDRYPYLISARKIAKTLSFFSKDSIEYYSQCVGTMKIGLMAKRVLTAEMCRQFRAADEVVWSGKATTKVYFVDSSYGGDKCVAGHGEFGEDIHGNEILAFGDPHEIPIEVKSIEPEDQISIHVREDCKALDIPASHMGHDSTGRGSLGTSLARIWSAETNPVEFGGKPTDRPVSLDMFVVDADTKQRRLKRCDEHYDRFVTELWFSTRYATEAGQIRRLPDLCKDDLCLRLWDDKNGKKSVEPKSSSVQNKNGQAVKKMGMKERVGRSPDYGDWACGIVEMARRKGFNIAKLAVSTPEVADDYLEQEAKKYREAVKSKLLQR